MKLALLSALLVACTSITGGGGGTDPVGSAGSSAVAAKKPGFSLNSEMAKDPGSGAGSGATATALAAAGTDPKPTSTTVTDPKPGNAPVDPKTFGTKDDGNHNSVPEPIVSKEAGPERPGDKRVHVDPGPQLAAIKLDLEPNWDRDYDTGGTISFVLKVPNTSDMRVFSFHYGYDLAGAPTDREAYKKFLADQKVLSVTLDRQRNAAWYLEGTDDKGNPGFRMLVTFGGKRLVCWGSLYKDKESAQLGPDLRDKVVNTAKKICETLAL